MATPDRPSSSTSEPDTRETFPVAGSVTKPSQGPEPFDIRAHLVDHLVGESHQRVGGSPAVRLGEHPAFGASLHHGVRSQHAPGVLGQTVSPRSVSGVVA